MRISNIDVFLFHKMNSFSSWLQEVAPNKGYRLKQRIHLSLLKYATLASLLLPTLVGILLIRQLIHVSGLTGGTGAGLTGWVYLWSVRYPLLSLCGATLSRLINGFIRRWIYKPRPQQAFETLALVDHKPSSSFPSNHAAGGFALAVPIFYCNPPIGFLLLFLAFVLAFSRLYVKLHYVTDVIAGAAVGGLTSGVLVYLITSP
jgi:membrane-associated phospholipid phosphatase